LKILEVHINNFKSIEALNLRFNTINILIGGNGAGKSNLISYFKLLNKIIGNNLQAYVSKNSGADNMLYFGRKKSPFIASQIVFKNGDYLNSYRFILEPNTEDNFYFTSEKIGFDKGANNWTYRDMGSGHAETKIFEHEKKNRGVQGTRSISYYVIKAFQGFKVYHFHDTSETAAVKQTGDINDNFFLREDASNLAPFLYMLSQKFPGNFNQIEATIKLIAPFFGKFNLQPSQLNPEKIRLEWQEIGSDKYFNAHNLSDGTLRMISLATLLLQPSPPDTIIIDEPELGLHPMAINILASLIKTASLKTQIIVSTQSVTLINQFAPENIIIVDRIDGQSSFKHINKKELSAWKDEYSLGEIWEKNLIGGRP
jgi:predicted ATPase